MKLIFCIAKVLIKFAKPKLRIKYSYSKLTLRFLGKLDEITIIESRYLLFSTKKS